MPISSGFNHIATIATDMDKTAAFYKSAFEAVETFRMAGEGDHPPMVILDIGGGAAMNIFEAPAESIVGDRAKMGGRGPIDHYTFMVEDVETLHAMRDRLVDAGADVGEVHQLGDTWSLFFRDPDGMELEVCSRAG